MQLLYTYSSPTICVDRLQLFNVRKAASITPHSSAVNQTYIERQLSYYSPIAVTENQKLATNRTTLAQN